MKKLLRNEEGSVIVLMVFLLPILIGFIGMTIDGGNIIYHKSKLIEATEAAGRSAILLSYDKTIWENEGRVVIDIELARESVENVLKMNFRQASLESVELRTENSLDINTSVTVKYTFMKLFGFEEKVIKSSQTSWGK